MKKDIPIPTIKVCLRVRSTKTFIKQFSAALYNYPINDKKTQGQIIPPVFPVAGSNTVTLSTDKTISPNHGLAIDLESRDSEDWGIVVLQFLGIVTKKLHLTFWLEDQNQAKSKNRSGGTKKGEGRIAA